MELRPFGRTGLQVAPIALGAMNFGGWRRLLDEPGDIVVGASEGAGCFGAAYEYLFNVSHQLRRAGLKRQVNLTYVTPEPELGHFGIGGLPHGEQLLGMFMRKERIASVIDTAIDHVDEGKLMLPDGTGLEFGYAMIVSPFVGPGGDPADDRDRRPQGLCQGPRHLPDRALRRCLRGRHRRRGGRALADRPRGRDPQDRPAHGADGARGGQEHRRPDQGGQPQAHKAFGDIPAVCVLDAGNNGVRILVDKMLPPRKHSLLIPGRNRTP